MKFNRSYRLTIDVSDSEKIVIEPPFTIRFSMVRDTQSSINQLTLSIINLGEKTRNKIFQDRYDFLTYKRVILEAGYKDLTKIFQGNLFEAYSERQQTEIVTNIVARDGGHDIYNSLTSKTLQGLTKREVIDSLIGEFSEVKQGKIGEIEGAFLRPVVLEGNTYELIRIYGGSLVYIDLERLHILKENEIVSAAIPLINSKNGLLETPRRRNSLVTITTLFQPNIILSQLVEIQSDVFSLFDGQYKVIGLTHSGIISDAVGGGLKSTFNLLVESVLFGKFKEPI